MVYNFFKKIGLILAVLMFSSAIVLIVAYLIKGFIESIIDWIETLQTIEGNITLHVASITIVIIFTFGVLLYIFGEILEFAFGKFPSILLEKKEYKLTEEDIEKISVIIPAYNEETTIEKAIEIVKPYCKNVIVVNDGSEDKTGEIAAKNGAVIVEHKLNRGLGQSLRDGIRRALSLGSEIIINFDADLQYRAEEIPDLVYYIIHEDYDLMMGSRLEGKIEKMSKFKKFGNKMYTRLLRYLTKVGVSDGQTGFRAFTKHFASIIKIRGDFTYTQEMILEATTKKAKIGEVPIHFDIREDGTSRLMKSPFHFAKSSGIFLVKVLIDLNPLKWFALFSSILIAIGFYLGGTEIIDWLITGVMDNSVLIIIGMIIIMGALLLLSVAVLVSSLKRD
jgi:glycosyltransferase involved in cell wall biosynthesis